MLKSKDKENFAYRDTLTAQCSAYVD